MDYKIRIINQSDNPVPTYATVGSAGLDLRSNENIALYAGHPAAIATGLFIELPTGVHAEIKSRSGLFIKCGICVGAGVIDEDFRGEIKVLLYNISLEPYYIHVGDRIAQMLFYRTIRVEMEDIKDFKIFNELSKTERGEGGFGSTGYV